jgi:hypothetical protein
MRTKVPVFVHLDMTVWGIFSLFFFCLFYNERQLSLQILLCEKKIFLFSLACCIAETQFVHFKLLATFFAHLLFFETFVTMPRMRAVRY